MNASIPASQIVSVNPGVIGAGGSGLSLPGLFLTSSYRVPVNTVQSFPTAAAVGAFFGLSSQEYALAQVYFLGPDNSSIKPGAMLFAQYAWALPVPAYLQSGSLSGLTLTQLQALSGTIIVTIGGTTFTSSAINLAAATSFSNAASLIQSGLAASEASVTASIATGVSSFTGSISGTTLTVSAISAGAVIPGSVLTGSGVSVGTTVVGQLTGTSGAAGTYQVSISQTASSTTITGASSQSMMTVTAVGSGVLAVGQNLSGSGVGAGTYIVALYSGTGGTGTYIVNGAQTATSTTITAGSATVTYDSQSGSFFIFGGKAASTGTIGYATGSLAIPLNLTQATGAVLSQGSNLSTPNAFMTNVLNLTQNFFSVLTVFNMITADKVALAAWVNAQDDDYCFVNSSADVTLIAANDTTSSVAIIYAAGYNGTVPIYDPFLLTAGPMVGALVASYFASLNFNKKGGRQTLAYRAQAGLPAGVTSGSQAIILAGNPQVAGDLGNHCNFYGAYGSEDTDFVFVHNGQISGKFLWADTYAHAAYIKNSLQNNLLSLLTVVGSIPYNTVGNTLIDNGCQPTITQMLAFGAIVPGVTLSALQIAEVNALAGVAIDQTLFQVGWYLSVGTASASVRRARGTPPIIFFYVDGGSVQSISLNSIVVQ